MFRKNVFWYEKAGDGSPVLVRPSGKRRTIGEKPYTDNFRTKQAVEGWQRAMLFMRERDIDDAMGFGTFMDAVECWTSADRNGCTGGVVMTTPQCAESAVYPFLPEAQVRRCRENVEDFYSDPDLQADMCENILSSVTLRYSFADDSLQPISMRELSEMEEPWEKEHFIIGALDSGELREKLRPYNE